VYGLLKYLGPDNESGMSGNPRHREELTEQIFVAISESNTGITRHTLMNRFGGGKEISEVLAVLRKDSRVRLVRGFRPDGYITFCYRANRRAQKPTSGSHACSALQITAVKPGISNS
jgi:hypothetical protein